MCWGTCFIFPKLPSFCLHGSFTWTVLCVSLPLLVNAHFAQTDNTLLLANIPALCSPKLLQTMLNPTIPPYLTISKMMALTLHNRLARFIQNTLSLMSANGGHMVLVGPFKQYPRLSHLTLLVEIQFIHTFTIFSGTTWSLPRCLSGS